MLLKKKCSHLHILFSYMDASMHLHSRVVTLLDYVHNKNDWIDVTGSYFTGTLDSRSDCIF